MEKFKINPFDRTSLNDIKLLAGRSNELKSIRFILKAASNQENRIKSLMISGVRGVGKTSLLNIIDTECLLNNIIPVRLNLVESNSINSNVFFWYLFHRLTDTLFEMGLLGGKGGDLHNAIQDIINYDGIKDPVNWVFNTPIQHINYTSNNNHLFQVDSLIHDLILIRNQITKESDKFNDKTKILFLVDESQKIYSNTKISEELRIIIQKQNIGYGFVFAGDSSFENAQWDIVFGGAHRDFEIINLDYFDEPEAVKEYFRKSLESIGWTEKEITEDLFYRFSNACSRIFLLTSGKPAWINQIAYNMFKRCMTGESRILRFDKSAMYDVREILVGSGVIDKGKLNFIESLPMKHQKWLSAIFASEKYTLNEVYFYAKFYLSGENLLTREEYNTFCNILIDNEIIFINKTLSKKQTIGFVSSDDNHLKKFETPYLIFGTESDPFKFWLQISSDRKYRFRQMIPEYLFIEHINNLFCPDNGNLHVIAGQRPDSYEEPAFRIIDVIKDIDNSDLDIVDLPFSILRAFYKFLKRLGQSRCKQVLFIKFYDTISNRNMCWNLYNTNDHDKLVEFFLFDSKIAKIKSTIESFNDDKNNYSIEITIDSLPDPNIHKLQNLIINCDDSKKVGIVIEDKMEELVTNYLKNNQLDEAYNDALFIYSLFNDGHDLRINNLNNAAYVLMVKKDYEKSINLLKAAVNLIKNKLIEQDEMEIATLPFYNLGICFAYQENYEIALDQFIKAIRFIEANELFNSSAGALIVLSTELSQISFNEIRSDKSSGDINIFEKAKENVTVLNSILKNK